MIKDFDTLMITSGPVPAFVPTPACRRRSAVAHPDFAGALTVYRTHHPVVRVHPETGARALLLGHFVQRFLELSGVDSKPLFDLFQTHITRLENTVRWRWSPGDIALWDNRSTQHYAVADYGDTPRRLHRVTVAGEVPVGPAGERSVAVTGDSAAYAGVASGAA
ncbi:taurine dioxygenase [Pseudonocardia ammonioxydans]|uniref:Taurine dioxygenase n=2 Tax=Pseudonocardia ammonioxydans TaxID=260086 RepID=A0A1I5B7C0_PSUAM|nr:taurine dioxygenase [Pseudonocardia ammonioxydans]